jgi:hypothetical protein
VPLIRALKVWISSRVLKAGYVDPFSLAVLWWSVILVLLPALLFMVLVGVVYELIIRIDRGRALDSWTLWTLSGIGALCLVAGMGMMLIVYLA